MPKGNLMGKNFLLRCSLPMCANLTTEVNRVRGYILMLIQIFNLYLDLHLYLYLYFAKYSKIEIFKLFMCIYVFHAYLFVLPSDAKGPFSHMK